MTVVEVLPEVASTQAYASLVNFNTATAHKIDSRAAGHYRSYKMTLGATDYKEFEVFGIRYQHHADWREVIIMRSFTAKRLKIISPTRIASDNPASATA